MNHEYARSVIEQHIAEGQRAHDMADSQSRFAWSSRIEAFREALAILESPHGSSAAGTTTDVAMQQDAERWRYLRERGFIWRVEPEELRGAEADRVVDFELVTDIEMGGKGGIIPVDRIREHLAKRRA